MLNDKNILIKYFVNRRGSPFVFRNINTSNICLFVHPFRMHLLITKVFYYFHPRCLLLFRYIKLSYFYTWFLFCFRSTRCVYKSYKHCRAAPYGKSTRKYISGFVILYSTHKHTHARTHTHTLTVCLNIIS